MENTTPKLGIIESDPWLEPYSAAIEGRHQHALDKELELTGGKGTLSDFATGYLYFGLHRTRRGWVFREWAPNAKEIYLIGDFKMCIRDRALAFLVESLRSANENT